MNSANHKLPKLIRLTMALFATLYHRIPYIFIATILLYGIGWVSVKGYYRFLPGDQFLIVQKAEVKDVALGNDTILTFCRETRAGTLDTFNVRSFISIRPDGTEQPSVDYTFPAAIEARTNCLAIPVTAERLPKQAGIYYAQTEVRFKVDGNEKRVSYTTPPFRISGTAQTLRDQIENLQRQITELQAKESGM